MFHEKQIKENFINCNHQNQFELSYKLKFVRKAQFTERAFSSYNIAKTSYIIVLA